MKLRNLTVSKSVARRNPHVNTTKRAAKKKSAQQTMLDKEKKLAERRAFTALCQREGIPPPTFEYRFDARTDPDERRLWRFDICWPELGIAVEVEGGMFQRNKDGSVGGGHAHPKHVRDQMQRYNEASVQGWIVLRTLPDDMKKRCPAILAEVAKAIQYRNYPSAPGYVNPRHETHVQVRLSGENLATGVCGKLKCGKRRLG